MTGEYGLWVTSWRRPSGKGRRIWRGVGPLVIKERLGTLDPKKLATADLETVFREKPAIHRFPSKMAERVHDLSAHVSAEYGGDAERVSRASSRLTRPSATSTLPRRCSTTRPPSAHTRRSGRR